MYPGQQKFSQFDPVTSTQSGDKIPILRGGQNKIITVDNFTGVIPDGWFSPIETWTYSSFSSVTKLGVITIPSGSLDRYPVNTRVWFKQSSINKYAVVVSCTTTTMTVAMLNGLTLDNVAISTPMTSMFTAPKTPIMMSWSWKPAIKLTYPTAGGGTGQVIGAGLESDMAADTVTAESTGMKYIGISRVEAIVAGWYVATAALGFLDAPNNGTLIKICRVRSGITTDLIPWEKVNEIGTNRGTTSTTTTYLNAGDQLYVRIANTGGGATRVGANNSLDECGISVAAL